MPDSPKASRALASAVRLPSPIRSLATGSPDCQRQPPPIPDWHRPAEPLPNLAMRRDASAADSKQATASPAFFGDAVRLPRHRDSTRE
ncbi:MAG: hypothetical protein R3F11_01655 [Verrucomicrobiales bacterium]